MTENATGYAAVRGHVEREGWTAANGCRVAQCARCATVALADTLRAVSDREGRLAVVCKQCAARIRRHGV